jgi:hypothetical protein
MCPSSNSNTYPVTNYSSQLSGSGNAWLSVEGLWLAVLRALTQWRKTSCLRWMTWLNKMSQMRCRVRSLGKPSKKPVCLMRWITKCLLSVATNARVLLGTVLLTSLTLSLRTGLTSWTKLPDWTNRIWDWFRSQLSSVSTSPIQPHSLLRPPLRVVAVGVCLRTCTRVARRRQSRQCSWKTRWATAVTASAPSLGVSMGEEAGESRTRTFLTFPQ